MASHAILEPSEEDALHGDRLLGIEDKLYKRLTKRLLAPTAPVSTPPQAPPTPPPDASAIDELAAERERHAQKQARDLREWRDDALIDFAGYESNLARVQFLFRSNELERERYAAEKERILETAEDVKANNLRLHVQLGEARVMLELRKTYDVLAEEITTNTALKPRDEQGEAIEKLKGEIAELERECGDYDKTWAERREQFGRIVEEGMGMLRLIRDEKEEAERMEEVDEVDGASRASTPKLGDEGSTHAVHKVHQSLKVGDVGGAASTPGTSRAPSPAPTNEEPVKGADGDVNMEGASEALEEGEEQDTQTTGVQDGMEIG